MLLENKDVIPTDEIEALRVTIAIDKETGKQMLGLYSQLEDEDLTSIIIALYDQRKDHIMSLQKKDNTYGDSDLLTYDDIGASVKIMDPIHK